MHEMSIMRNVVDIVQEHAAGRPVRRLRLEVGLLSGVMPDALRFCFDMVARGTVLEGAVLEIVELPVRACCSACGEEEMLHEIRWQCSRCGGRLQWQGGDELAVKEMELA